MNTAVIVDAVRTPGGRRGGKLANWHAVDLAALSLKAIVERNNLDPALIDDVILGCVNQVGEQAINVARSAVLAAGFPESVTATTIDRQCGSSQQAVHFAAQGVIAGAYDIVIAGGVESMTRVPMGASTPEGLGAPFGPAVLARYADRGGRSTMGGAAELIADTWDLSRQELDAYGARSQQRARQATDEGRFQNEIVPVQVKDADGQLTDEWFTLDEGLRDGTTAESLSGLKTPFKENGKITAGTSSQVTDGSSAVLIMSEERANALGLTPRARFHSFALAGVDSVMMLTGPIPATRTVLERGKLSIEDIDRFEVNEAFASIVLAWAKELGVDLDKVNVNGGAIALGHPVGSSGTRLMATLLNELERSGGHYGLQVMCEGGGQANATIIERLG
jgi:acetyl-CoA acyltransferase